MKVNVKYCCLRMAFVNQKMVNLVFVGDGIYIIFCLQMQLLLWL